MDPGLGLAPHGASGVDRSPDTVLRSTGSPPRGVQRAVGAARFCRADERPGQCGVAWTWGVP